MTGAASTPRLGAVEDLERRLATALREYLTAEDEVGRRERGRQLSNAVAWLTSALLRDQEVWSRYWGVDDLLEDSIETVSQLALEIRGDLIWGDGRNDWVEPLRAFISLASPSPSDQFASYEIQLGDAAMGLQKVGYGNRRFGPRTDPTEWLFTFHGGATTHR